jgi:hypothetical protein
VLGEGLGVEALQPAHPTSRPFFTGRGHPQVRPSDPSPPKCCNVPPLSEPHLDAACAWVIQPDRPSGPHHQEHQDA